MIKNNFILLLIVASAIAKMNFIFRDRGDGAEEFLRNLREKVDHALKKTQKELNSTKDSIDQVASQVQEVATYTLESSKTKIEADIDELKKRASSEGVSIDQCLIGKEEAILAISDKFSAGIVHCISDTSTEGIGYAQDVLYKIQRIFDDITDSEKEMKYCMHSIKYLMCITNLVVKLQRDLTILPAAIGRDTAAASALILQLEPILKKCAYDKTNDFQNETESIYANINLCANDILGPLEIANS